MNTDIKVIYGDGITDDTEALQHYINGGKVVYPDGPSFPQKRDIGKTIEYQRYCYRMFSVMFLAFFIASLFIR